MRRRASSWTGLPLLLLAGVVILGWTAGPDYSLPPGAINLQVTQANIAETICVQGWTRTVRPPVEYTSALKRQQIQERHLPGTLIFGRVGESLSTSVCGRTQHINGSGRLVLCEGRFTGDGLLYTRDGMFVSSKASMDYIGAIFNDHNGSQGPSLLLDGGMIILRYDPLALVALGDGFAALSWQQIR